MRVFSPATAAYFASREAFSGQVLIWVSPRNRDTGEVEPVGFWSGGDHQAFTIDGEVRTYYGAGEFATLDPIRRQTGIKTRTQRLTFSHVTPAAVALVRGYDLQHAPIEIHRALYHPLNETLIDEPHVILRGFVDKALVTRPPKNEAGGKVVLEIATHARALTRTLARYRSDATLRARAPDDEFRQYASIADSVDTPWGRNAASGSNSAGTPRKWGPSSNAGSTPNPPATGGGSWPRR